MKYQMKTPINSTTPKRSRLSQVKILTLAATLIVPAATGLSQNYWQGPANGSADYTNAADWAANAVPTGGSANPADDNGSNSVILIQAGDPTWSVNSVRAGWEDNDSGSYIQSGSTVTTALKVRLGVGNSGVEGSPTMNTGSAGYYTLNGGTLNSGSDINVGEFGIATLNVNGGAINTSGNLADNDYQWAASNGGGTIGTVNTETDVVNQAGGIITLTGDGQLFVGNGGPAIYNMSGGTNIVNNYIAIGRSGGNGTFNMTGGLLVQNGGGNLVVGSGYQAPSGINPVGVLNQSGGTINCVGQFMVPDNTPGAGTYNMSGTAVLNCNNWIAIGRGGVGTLNISGGTISKTDGNNDHFDVGAGGNPTGAAGTINQTGGTITNTTSDFWLGEIYEATWNMSGGSNELGNVVMSVNDGVTSTLNLNGGLFQATSINTPSPSSLSLLNLNGGTLQANANNTAFINGVYLVSIDAGGAIIDSQGYNITIPELLQDNNNGAATLTKLGSGTLTLSAANSYGQNGGATIVSAGTLVINTTASASANYSVADHAALGILVQSSGAQLQPQQNVTLGNSVGATLNLDLGGFGNTSTAPLNVGGAFTANGTIAVNVTDFLPSMGLFPLVQYNTRAGSGNFVLGSLPTGVSGTIVTNGNTIALNITAVNQPYWDGEAGGNWDIGLTTNWINIGTGLPTYYSDGSPVVFDDSAPGTTTVNVTTTVKPSSVTVNNTNLAYTFVGSGSISGSAGLSKQGANTLAILNVNSYTGPTVIGNGIVSITNLANGGSPSPLGASSATPTNLTIVDGTLSYVGAPVTVNRGFNVAGTNATIDAEDNLTFGGNVTAVNNSTDGGSALTKVGPAQLDLTGSGENLFSVNASVGVSVVAGTLLMDGSAGNQTNSTPAQLFVGDTTASGAALVLTNTTLNVGSWLALGRINGGIDNTSSITLYNSAVTCGNLSLGWDGGLPNNLSSQFLTLNGSSSLTNYGAVNMPEGANSSMTLTINSNSVFWVRNPFYICLANNTTGTVVVANSGKIVSANGWFDIGEGGNCFASMLLENNASLGVLGGDLNLGDTATSSTSTLWVQDNATVQANTLWIGKSTSGVGTATFTNSSTAHFNSYIDLASGGSSTGTLNMAGGSVTDGGDMTLGDQGTAVLNMVTNSGSVLTVNGTLYLSRNSQVADGTVNLNPGTTIVADYINNGWGFHNGYSSPLDNPNAFNFNGGTLKANVGSAYFIQPYVNAVVQAGGAVIDDGGYSIEVLTSLVTGGGNGGLTKLDTGTLRLDGVNTYTGSTLVSAGTLVLGPGGVIAGPVTVASGAILAGDAGVIETNNINNTLALSAGSTTAMTISLTNSDEIQGLTSVNYGGSLVVTNNSGSPLVVGATYTLFKAASAGTGSFSSVAILPEGAGTFNASTGVLTITSATGFVFNPVTASGGNLILTGTGGSAGGPYMLESTTNLLSSWITNSTGTLNGSGSYSNAIPINPAQPTEFFRLVMP